MPAYGPVHAKRRRGDQVGAQAPDRQPMRESTIHLSERDIPNFGGVFTNERHARTGTDK